MQSYLAALRFNRPLSSSPASLSNLKGKESRLFLPTVAGAPRVSCIDGRRVAWPAAFRTKDSKSSSLTILCLSPLHGAIQREKDVEAQCLTSGPSCTPGSSAEQAPPQKLSLHDPATTKTKKNNNNKTNSKNIPTSPPTLPTL